MGFHLLIDFRKPVWSLRNSGLRSNLWRHKPGCDRELPGYAVSPGLCRYYRSILILVGGRVRDLYRLSRFSLVVIGLVGLSLHQDWAILVEMLPRTVPALGKVASGSLCGVLSFFRFYIFLLSLWGSLLGIFKIVLRLHGSGHQGSQGLRVGEPYGHPEAWPEKLEEGADLGRLRVRIAEALI